MNDVNNCIICGRELEYFAEPPDMTCMICRRQFEVNAACRDGHYVCDQCHAADGLTAIEGMCRNTPSAAPLEIAMGCDVTCPYIGREFDANWQLPDPTGQGDEAFERVIGEIEQRILRLKADMEVRGNG